MDRFDELDTKLREAMERCTVLLQAMERFRKSPPAGREARLGLAEIFKRVTVELPKLKEMLDTCMAGPVTEEFLEATLAQYDRTVPAIMASIEAQGGVT
jgi:hypothetical protein